MHPMDDDELRYGRLLYQEHTPLLQEYILWRLNVAKAKLNGLLSASEPDEAALAQARRDVSFYQARMEA